MIKPHLPDHLNLFSVQQHVQYNLSALVSLSPRSLRSLFPMVSQFHPPNLMGCCCCTYAAAGWVFLRLIPHPAWFIVSFHFHFVSFRFLYGQLNFMPPRPILHPKNPPNSSHFRHNGVVRVRIVRTFATICFTLYSQGTFILQPDPTLYDERGWKGWVT